MHPFLSGATSALGATPASLPMGETFMNRSRHRFLLTSALFLFLAMPGAAGAQSATSTMDAAAVRLYGSLTDAQRQAATLPFDSPERVAEVFTGGKRAGVQLKALTPEQREMALGLVGQFTSDYGRAKAALVADQDPADPGFGRYYLCFFGTPGADKRWAWRVAEHHLTLVHVEVEEGKARTLGPILLGANPPTLWDDEEAAMMELWAAMSPEERGKAKVEKQMTSSFMMKAGQGVQVGDLGGAAREKVKDVLASRLKFFSPEVAERVTKVIEGQGGIEALRVAFYGEATKRCREGGKWDFKLGGEGFLCDYENSRGHIHFALKGSEAARGGR